MTARTLSAEELLQRERRAFVARFELRCASCAPELHQEHAGLDCRHCGAPLVRIVRPVTS
jgi:rRNA maturation endonuclease Nob1